MTSAQPDPSTHQLNPSVPEAISLITGLLTGGVLSVELLHLPSTAPAPASVSPGVLALHAALRVVRELVEAGLLDPAGLASTVTLPVLTATASDPALLAPARELVPGERITVRDLVVKAAAGCQVNTRRTYFGYMELLSEGYPADAAPEDKVFAGFGDRYADTILPSELETALAFVEKRALGTASKRAEARESLDRVTRTSNASGAKYNAVGAWRRMFKVAVKDRHLTKAFDPSQEVAKPKRSEGTRQALEQQQLEDAVRLIETTGDDPELDRLIVDTILIAGARREGILNLTLSGIDRTEMTVRLDEKFGKVVHQPVPDWLIAELHAFAIARGAVRPADQVFRKRAGGKRAGGPITGRRFDNIFQRLQAGLEWADVEQVSAHTLRHHAISVVERASSKAVSLRFARHEPEDANDRYSKATDKEVAQVIVRLYGGDHPWVHRDRRHRRD